MVTVETYNPDWPHRFHEQAALLGGALGALMTAIEHVGSTAVPGLAAKPIIDLAARAAAGVDPYALEPLIAGLGYHQHRSGPKTHAVYTRHNEAGRTDILHVFTETDWPTCHQRVFRDKLLHDPVARRRYGELKLQLASAGLSGQDYTGVSGPTSPSVGSPPA